LLTIYISYYHFQFKAGPPTLVPSLNLGLQGCITPIKTSPPNSNSLFDFAISGPLVGMIISVCLLYSGLEKQVFMDAAAQANLPSLPVNLVRSSSLAGGMVEWLLGDGTLVSGDADPSALIRLHPFAIAGFVGIVSNALNLLPVGNTDGGRVAQALYGRGFAKFIRNLTLVSMVLAGFFGGDEVNLLLFFAIFAQIWQKEPEVPCKNEIDGVSDERAILAFLTAFLVGLAVVPMSLG
jgi:membrane-associated protease RseP (regulator of RpoE activity)